MPETATACNAPCGRRKCRQRTASGSHFRAAIDSAPGMPITRSSSTAGIEIVWREVVRRIVFIRHAPSWPMFVLYAVPFMLRNSFAPDLRTAASTLRKFADSPCSGTGFRKSLRDLIRLGLGMFGQAEPSRSHRSRRAIADCAAPRSAKASCKRMQLPIFPEALHSQDCLPPHSSGKHHNSKKHRLAVQKNGASAAFTSSQPCFVPVWPDLRADFQQGPIGANKTSVSSPFSVNRI